MFSAKLLGFTAPGRPWPPFSRPDPQNSLAKPSDMLASVKPDWDGNHLPGPSGTIWDSQVLVINCHQPRPGVSSPLAPSPAAGHIGKALVLIPPQHARPSHQSSWGMEHWCILKNNIKRQSKHIRSYKHDANNKLWYWLTMGPYGSLWYGILWYIMAASCSSCIMTNSGGLLEFQPAWPWGSKPTRLLRHPWNQAGEILLSVYRGRRHQKTYPFVAMLAVLGEHVVPSSV